MKLCNGLRLYKLFPFTVYVIINENLIKLFWPTTKFIIRDVSLLFRINKTSQSVSYRNQISTNSMLITLKVAL